MSIGRFSVSNSVLVTIATVVILVLGFFSLRNLPQEQFSEVPFFFVNITVPYPGVAAADVERNVTIPIEDEMQGLDRLDTVRSISDEGVSVVTLEFDQGVGAREFDSLFQEVRNRFSNVSLPDGTLQASIEDFSSNDFLPVIEVVLYGETEYEVLNRSALELRDRLRRVPEVSGVTPVGSRDRKVLISVDRSRAEAIGLALDEVVAAVRSRNVTVPGGTISSGARDYILRTVGEIRDLDEFERTVVRTASSDGQGVVLLGDVAEIREDYDSEAGGARFNGLPAISLRITKIPGGSSIGVIDEARRVATAYASDLPTGVELAFFNDSTVQIRDSLDVLISNAVLGLILLVVILFLFVGIRNALMTGLGIPVTFAVTFIILEATGETLNSNTLFALVLVLGLIVDHAIVIVENSYRLQSEGLSQRDAAVRGVDQVVIPIIAATATTIAAFLPLAFLPGVIGRFLRVVPITVTIALVASTFEASVFLPSHYADWPGGSRPPRRRVLEKMQSLYAGFIRRVYRHKFKTVALMFVIMIGTFGLVRTIPPDLFAAEDFSVFFIEIEMPPGTPLQRTDEIVAEFEAEVLPRLGDGEIISVVSTIGFTGRQDGSVTRSSVAQLTVDLAELDDGRTRSIAEVMGDIQESTLHIAGPETVRFRKAPSGPPQDPPIVFRFFGEELEELAQVTEAVRLQLTDFPEVFDIQDNLDQGSPELRILVDENAAARFGLSKQSIGNFVRASFDGVPAGSFFSRNEEAEVLVRYGGATQSGVEQLVQLRIPNRAGLLVPFSSVARIEEAGGISSIRRLDGRREATVEAETYTNENLAEINRSIRSLYDDELAERFQGVELAVGGRFAEILNILLDILRVFLVGIFAIYAILGTQFKSYLQPFLILLSVPFAFVGVILYLILSGTALSTTVIYAGVALAGIAVNDTIVLVSFINERRKEGAPVAEAVIDGAVTRLRPILLTSFTTIGGLLPIAMGLGGESIVWGPMASTIVFGLLFSTLTALVVVPCLYGILYERRDRRRPSEA
ncbi:MAG: efflux RND transporter permease subunit [Spirochaetaceae bacterium]|nr:MAG: efflux RND transporter permease subunit [Spirochaetaceae bacterium]